MLSGHIWKCVTQAWKFSGSQETKLFIATDHWLFMPQTPTEGHFGNVIFMATPMSMANELVENPLTYAAGKVSFCCNASFDAVLLFRLSEGGIVLSMSVFLNLKTTYKDGAKI
jgi:hypothetical protein